MVDSKMRGTGEGDGEGDGEARRQGPKGTGMRTSQERRGKGREGRVPAESKVSRLPAPVLLAKGNPRASCRCHPPFVPA